MRKSVYITEEQHEVLRKKSYKERKSMFKLLKEIVQEWLEKNL